MTAPRDAAPVPFRADASRIAALDVVRGVAILGTFGTSVWLFTLPGGAGSFDPIVAGAGFWETALPALANGKFLALLSLLFGIGLELQYRAAVRRGLTWPGRYLRRAAILFAEGLVHYVLVFEWDILMGYALTSVVVAYLVGRSHRAQTAWMLAIGVPYVAFLAAVTALLVVAPSATFAPIAGPTTTASWVDQVLGRLDDAVLYRAELLLVLPSSTVLFLLAVRLFRAGVFGDDDPGRRLRARLMRLGLGIGVPANVATAWAGTDWWLIERYIAGPLIALGLLALVTHLVLVAGTPPSPSLRSPGSRSPSLRSPGAPSPSLRSPGAPSPSLRSPGPGFVQGSLAAVGRVALTCYVLQNVVASVLAYQWGLGLTARLGGLGVWYPVLLWCVVVVVNVVFARLWLRRFDRGPLELVAHRLA